MLPIPKKPQPVGCLGGLFFTPDPGHYQAYQKHMDTAQRRVDSISSLRDRIIQIERACEASEHLYLCIVLSTKMRKPEIYDEALGNYWRFVREIEPKAIAILDEYHEDRLRTLHGFKSRDAQARSAHKTLGELERLRDDYLPDQAEAAYRKILGFWQDQVQILER